ncbi:MAG: hypothetical protein Q4C85_05500 [Actinomyces sp.]|uniref:hypothetical protein n=1 Tax=Actinomyces sp. TaxID=29317 RepID=UPI0026DA9772|nr:hypothetical protein [Actinomyces sp.]MDO4243205.1 hypothetical protein [Actinomyces sp.]
MTPLPPRRALAVAAAVALAAGALVGCSAHPGQAAVLSYTDAAGARQDVSISVETVEEATSELAPAIGVSGTEVLQGLIDLPLLESFAAEYGVVVTDATVLEALEGQLGPGEYSQASIDYVRSALITQNASSLDQETLAELQARYDEAISTVELEVAPRYQGVQPWVLQTEAPVVQAG